MKLAVTGKGGVGKTTTSALLANALHAQGLQVIALDADPDSNLAACMGVPNPETIKPLIELKDLIEERTGAKPGTTGAMFRLNPFVEDIPGKYAVEVNGIKVLVSGAIKKGGAGCYCPENTMVRALISHLLFEKDTALVLDMEAGVEHLNRGTVGSVDYLIVVVDPGRRGVETAIRIQRLAKDIGIPRVSAIGNKIRSESDKEFLRNALPDVDFVGFLPFDEGILEAERNGKSVIEASDAVTAAITETIKILARNLN